MHEALDFWPLRREKWKKLNEINELFGGWRIFRSTDSLAGSHTQLHIHQLVHLFLVSSLWQVSLALPHCQQFNSANIICTEKLSCQWFIYFPRTVFLINFPSYIYAVPPTPDKPPAAVQQPGHLPESPRSPSHPMATGSSIAHWVMYKQNISLLEVLL